MRSSTRSTAKARTTERSARAERRGAWPSPEPPARSSRDPSGQRGWPGSEPCPASCRGGPRGQAAPFSNRPAVHAHRHDVLLRVTPEVAVTTGRGARCWGQEERAPGTRGAAPSRGPRGRGVSSRRSRGSRGHPRHSTVAGTPAAGPRGARPPALRLLCDAAEVTLDTRDSVPGNDDQFQQGEGQERGGLSPWGRWVSRTGSCGRDDCTACPRTRTRQEPSH